MHRLTDRLTGGIIGALALALIAVLAGVVSAGPLDPPPGTPASTDGVREAGTPISSVPFVISTPGRYYLTRHLSLPGAGTAITIASSDVTLDMNGFTLTGADQGVGVLADLAQPTPYRNITITRGSVRGFDYGFLLYSVYNRLDALSALNNEAGFEMQFAYQSELTNCNASGNLFQGVIIASSAIRNCTITDNGGAGIIAAVGNSLIEGNKIRSNGHTPFGFVAGIWVDTAANTIRNNEITANLPQDIRLLDGAGESVVKGNVYCVLAVDTPTPVYHVIDNVDRTTC